MTRNRAILSAAGLAVALLVTGCSTDSPEPPASSPSIDTSATPDVSPSPEPSATSVVVQPERPAAMDDDGPAGAEAAAVYFLELDDYIMKTNDTAEWEAMSGKGCGYCTKRLDQANEIARKNYSWESEPSSARVTHTYEQDSATEIWPLDVEVLQGAVRLTDSNGEVIYAEDQVTLDLGVEMGRHDGQWTVLGVGQVEEG
ncbi:hypothetical protein GCM10009809_26470 [Isoptericola hypogeus]|uniref:DUF6318 domain-containing protein n=1 Tax=Isoptericola hypogeus TaxID=300179 RepID=A0ABP4VN19_9MICO